LQKNVFKSTFSFLSITGNNILAARKRVIGYKRINKKTGNSHEGYLLSSYNINHS
jgi:hypothetical protein